LQAEIVQSVDKAGRFRRPGQLEIVFAGQACLVDSVAACSTPTGGPPTSAWSIFRVSEVARRLFADGFALRR